MADDVPGEEALDALVHPQLSLLGLCVLHLLHLGGDCAGSGGGMEGGGSGGACMPACARGLSPTRRAY